MTKKRKDEFIEWFVAQHGKRPSNKDTYELRNKLMDALVLAENARSLLERCQRYDAQLTSSKYAKNAFGVSKT